MMRDDENYVEVENCPHSLTCVELYGNDEGDDILPKPYKARAVTWHDQTLVFVYSAHYPKGSRSSECLRVADAWCKSTKPSEIKKAKQFLLDLCNARY